MLIALMVCTLNMLGSTPSEICLKYDLLTTDNGLPANYITTMVQDNRGFIWMGTSDGLVRYDGYDFLTFRHEDKNCEMLLRNTIRNLYFNSNGLLFIRLRNDQYSCYDTNRQCFVDFTGGRYNRMASYRDCAFMSNGDTWLWSKRTGALRIRYGANGLSSRLLSKHNGLLKDNNVTFITDDQQGTVWIGTVKGICSLKDNKLRRSHEQEAFNFCVTMPDGLYFTTADGAIYHAVKNGIIQKIADFNETAGSGIGIWNLVAYGDRIIIVTLTDTWQLDTKSRQVSRCPDIQAPNAQVGTDNRGNTFLSDINGMVWHIERQTGKLRAIKAAESWQLEHIASSWCRVVSTADGYLCINTMGNGIIIHDTKTGRQKHWTASPKQLGSLPNNYIFYAMEDHSGNLWASAENNGLVRYSIQPRSLSISFPSGWPLFSRSNYIRMVRQTDDGTLWVGNKTKQLFVSSADRELTEVKMSDSHDVLTIAKDQQGTLWMGLRDYGLKIGNRLYQNVRGDSTSLAHNKVTHILRDDKGRMWLTTYGGICLAEQQADGSYRFRKVIGGNDFMRFVNMMTQLSDGWMMAGCADGIIIFHPDTILQDPRAYHYYNHKNSIIGNFDVRDIAEDRHHRVWIGSAGGGLYHLENRDYAHLQLKLYTTADGLSNNSVNTLQYDEKGILWIGTDYGLTRLDTEHMYFTRLYPSHDKASNIFSENSSALMADGTLVFGTNNGLLYFNQKEGVPMPETPIKPVISNLLINGAPYGDILDKGILLQDEIELEHDQNSLTIHFSDLGFLYPNITEYIYKLEGFDKEWSMPTDINATIYKNLPPGSYEFHVKALSADGKETTEEAVLSINILEPWYNTWWAWLIYLLVMATACYYVYGMLRSNYVLQNRMKMERENMDFRLRFFMDISHEFRTPLALIRGSMDKLSSVDQLPSNIKQPLGNMNRSVNRLMRLINQLMEFNKMEKGKLQLRLSETDVVSYIRDIAKGFRDIAETHSINFNISTFAHSYTMYADKGYIDKIVYNLLSNAFKYTDDKGSITLRLQLQDDCLRISVEDTGVGVPEEKRGRLFERFANGRQRNDGIGIGLHLTARLAETHHGRVWYEPNEPKGSIFFVELPTSKDVYQPEDFMTEELKSAQQENDSTGWLADYKEMAARPLNDRTVLIVEDDGDLLTYLKEELQQYFIVKLARDGQEAWDAIKEEKPHLIISDIKMPQMSGLELLKRIRTNEELFDIPLMLLSSETSIKKQLQGAQYAADAYVPKPFDRELLITRALSLIEQRERLRQAYAKHETESNKPELLMASDQDRRFLDQFDMLIERGLSDPNMNVDEIAEKMHYSRSRFYSKVKNITGLTPNEYIKPKRMQRAAELLQDQVITVAEVAYKVGFSDPLYFGRCFKQYYGVTPSKYQRGV